MIPNDVWTTKLPITEQTLNAIILLAFACSVLALATSCAALVLVLNLWHYS